MNTQVAKKSIVLMVVIGLAASGLFLVSTAQAANRTWTGTGGTTMSTAGSWNPATNPANNDFFFFGSQNDTGALLTNDLATTVNFGGITFNAGAVAYTINAGTATNVYVLEATPTGTGISNLSTNLQTINFNMSTTTAQTINMTAGGGNITFGTGAVVSGAGGLTLTGTGTLTLDAADTYTGATTIGATNILKLANTNAVAATTVTINPTNGGLVFDSTAAASTSFTVGGIGGAGNISLADVNNNTIAITMTTNTGTYTGDISGIGSLIKNTSGALALNANQDYTGSTTVNAGSLSVTGNLASSSITVNAGTMTVSGNAAASTVLVNGGSLSIGGNSSATTMTINAGTLTVTGTSSSATTLNVAGGTMTLTGATSATQLNLGNGTFVAGTGDSFTGGTILTALTGGNIGTAATVAGSGVLALNTITRNTGAGVNFTLPTSGSITAINANTGSSILGGWATVGGTDWAVSAGNGSIAGAITVLGSYTNDTWSAGNNTTVTTSSSPTSSSTTNSLRFGSAAANTVTLSGTNTITSGGILVSSAVGSNSSVITGGNLQASSGGELILNQQNTAGNLTIGSAIVDNGTSSLTKLGGGLATLIGSNTYAGVTDVSGGSLQIGNGGTSGSLGSGNVAIGPSANLIYNRSDSQTYPNTFSGTGTITVASTGGTGSLLLRNASGFSGTVAANGGSLILDFPSSSLTSNIVNSSGKLALGGGSLIVNGNQDFSGGNSQTFASTTLNAGASVVSVAPTTGSMGNLPILALGALTYNTGSTVVFNGPATVNGGGNVAATGIIKTTTAGVAATGAGNGNGVLTSFNNTGTSYAAAYATVGLYDWASTSLTDGTLGTSPYTIIGGSQVPNFYNPQTGNATLAGNVDASTAALGSHNTDNPNTVRFNLPGNTSAVTWTLTGVVSTGGVLVTPNIGAFNVTVSGPNGDLQPGLRSSSAGSMVLWQNNTLGNLVFNTALGDGKTAGSAYVVAGLGTVVMPTSVANSYTGQTYLNGGYTEIFSNGSLGTVTTGAQLNLNGGTLVGNVASGSYTLDNAGANKRPVVLGLSGGGIAATTTATNNYMTVSGVVSGSGPLTIGVPSSSANGSVIGQLPGTGTGTANAQVLTGGGVQLSGANTYTGGTNVVYGALYAGNASGSSATGTGAVTVGGNGILGGGNAGGTAGFITGAVSLQSGGQLSPGIPAANGFSGFGTLTVGGLTFATGSILNEDLSGGANDKTISTNGLNLNSGTKLNLYAGGSLSQYTLNGTFTLFDIKSGTVPSLGTLNSDVVINNPAGGAMYTWGESSDGGGGTNITLQISGLTPIYNWIHSSGENWQTGTNWDQGTAPGNPGDSVSFNSTNSAASGATSIALNGARTAGSVTFNDTAAQFSIDPGSPAGTLTLNNNTHGASVVVTNGNHAITANVTLADNVTLTATNPTDTLTIGNSSGSTGSISGGSYNVSVSNGAGNVIFTSANSYANTSIDLNNALQIGNGTSTTASLGTGSVALNGTLTVNRPNAYNVTNSITGGGTFIQSGGGMTTLSGANSGAWSTTINSGTLQIGSGSNIGTGNLTMTSGILDLNGASPSVNSLSGSGTIDNVSSTTASVLTDNQTTTTAFSGNIQNTAGPSGGTVALTLAGTGNLTLSGINTYSGNTTINGGILTLTSSTAVAAGTTIQVHTNPTTNGVLQLSGNINVAANVNFAPNGSNINDSLDVVAGSNPTISGNITTTGITSSAQLRLVAGGVAGDTTTSVTFTGIANFAPLSFFDLERGDFVVAGTGQFNVTTSETLWVGRSAGNSTTFTVKNNSTMTVPAIILAAGGATTTSSIFTVQDNAAVTLALSGAPGGFELNGEGGTSVTTLQLNGGTLNVGDFTQTPGTSLSTGGTAFNLNGGTIVAGESTTNFIPVLNTGSTNASFNQQGPVVQALGAKINTNGFAITIVAPLIHDPTLGAGLDDGLTKSGLGTLTLGDPGPDLSSTYNGPTTVNQGTLAMGIVNAISNQSAIVLNGGTLSSGGHNQSLSTLQVQGTNSALDFGTTQDASDHLQFADSHLVAWSSILRIKDWVGLAGGGGQDQVLFGSSSGLSAGQLADVHFNGYLTGAKFVGSSGEIVPLNSSTHLILGEVNPSYPHVDANQILPFEQALANLAGYESTNGYDFADVQDIMDINGDGLVNYADLQSFIGYLNGGHGNTAGVPEPSSLVLFGLALPAVWVASRRRRKPA
ncbi:MAG TPA: autotransporter-associated beta strand repeat-containing protein [Pirellulales bacterium]|nr:autotransporter-associated beta strand repeat-containing protein [Pirellulales bacterium]